MKDKTKAELTETFNAYKIPCSPVNTIPELMNSPQLKARNMLVPIHDEGIGDYIATANPMFLSETPAVIKDGAPMMGRDTDKILKELGYTAEDIDRLRTAEAV